MAWSFLAVSCCVTEPQGNTLMSPLDREYCSDSLKHGASAQRRLKAGTICSCKRSLLQQSRLGYDLFGNSPRGQQPSALLVHSTQATGFCSSPETELQPTASDDSDSQIQAFAHPQRKGLDWLHQIARRSRIAPSMRDLRCCA